MSELVEKILALSHLRSPYIASELGCSARYVRRVLNRHGHAHPHGPPSGPDNPAWTGGRIVDLDGYVLLKTKPIRIAEHRHVMECQLGRSLVAGEVVDHIDGITIHNDPTNLRLFESNSEHLRETLKGRPKQICASGLMSIKQRFALPVMRQPVDTYRLRKERGDVRLRAILRAALELGITHPCLCGTTHWLERNGIDPRSRPSLVSAWEALERRYAEDLLR